jgi:hypothetical protein
LCRHRVVVGAKLVDIDRDGACALRSVDQHRDAMPGQLADRQDGAIKPRDVGDSDEARPRCDLSLDRWKNLSGRTLANRRDAKRGAGGDQPPKKPGVLRIGRHDLVARPNAEAAQHDVASLGRRAREGDSLRMRPQQAREFGAQQLTFVQDSLKIRAARSALFQLAVLHLLHGRYGYAR